VTITRDSRAVKLAVKVAPTTPVGDYDSLVCRLSGQVDGQAVVFQIGRGGVLKVAPPGALSADSTGRPLSPLEALRRRASTQATARP
jgi:hypothetical protein